MIAPLHPYFIPIQHSSYISAWTRGQVAAHVIVCLFALWLAFKVRKSWGLKKLLAAGISLLLLVAALGWVR